MFFFIKKIFEYGEYTVEMCTYSPSLNQFSLYAPVCFRHDCPTFIFLRTYFMDGLLEKLWVTATF